MISIKKYFSLYIFITLFCNQIPIHCSEQEKKIEELIKSDKYFLINKKTLLSLSIGRLIGAGIVAGILYLITRAKDAIRAEIKKNNPAKPKVTPNPLPKEHEKINLPNITEQIESLFEETHPLLKNIKTQVQDKINIAESTIKKIEEDRKHCSCTSCDCRKQYSLHENYKYLYVSCSNCICRKSDKKIKKQNDIITEHKLFLELCTKNINNTIDIPDAEKLLLMLCFPLHYIDEVNIIFEQLLEKIKYNSTYTTNIKKIFEPNIKEHKNIYNYRSFYGYTENHSLLFFIYYNYLYKEIPTPILKIIEQLTSNGQISRRPDYEGDVIKKFFCYTNPNDENYSIKKNIIVNTIKSLDIIKNTNYFSNIKDQNCFHECFDKDLESFIAIVTEALQPNELEFFAKEIIEMGNIKERYELKKRLFDFIQPSNPLYTNWSFIFHQLDEETYEKLDPNILLSPTLKIGSFDSPVYFMNGIYLGDKYNYDIVIDYINKDNQNIYNFLDYLKNQETDIYTLIKKYINLENSKLDTLVQIYKKNYISLEQSFFLMNIKIISDNNRTHNLPDWYEKLEPNENQLINLIKNMLEKFVIAKNKNFFKLFYSLEKYEKSKHLFSSINNDKQFMHDLFFFACGNHSTKESKQYDYSCAKTLLKYNADYSGKNHVNQNILHVLLLETHSPECIHPNTKDFLIQLFKHSLSTNQIDIWQEMICHKPNHERWESVPNITPLEYYQNRFNTEEQDQDIVNILSFTSDQCVTISKIFSNSTNNLI